MQAVQAKNLKPTMSEERFKAFITKRMAQGLYYNDEDHPEDDMDREPMSMFHHVLSSFNICLGDRRTY